MFELTTCFEELSAKHCISTRHKTMNVLINIYELKYCLYGRLLGSMNIHKILQQSHNLAAECDIRENSNPGPINFRHRLEYLEPGICKPLDYYCHITDSCVLFSSLHIIKIQILYVLETLHSRRWNGILENVKNGVHSLLQFFTGYEVCIYMRPFLNALRWVSLRFWITDTNSKLNWVVSRLSDKRTIYVEISHTYGMLGFISGFRISLFWSLIKPIRMQSTQPKTIHSRWISVCPLVATSPK